MRKNTRAQIFFYVLISSFIIAQPKPKYNLNFNEIPKTWDTGLPLGNGTLGALIWQKGKHLRMSLDNAYIWDDRPTEALKQLKYNWVVEQVNKKDIAKVKELGDEPYDNLAAPTKIPGAAIEINTEGFGKAVLAKLDIQNAVAEIKWDNGTELTSYVSAVSNCGVFTVKNLNQKLDIRLLAPQYGDSTNKARNSLYRLGYTQGKVIKNNNHYEYFQPCYGNTAYKVVLDLSYSKNQVIGVWSIVWMDDKNKTEPKKTLNTSFVVHQNWWKNYWNKSSISIPDEVIAKQYYREMYKFGSAARQNTPPITLQAVWTADDGNIPPWKGDFHHDLNTELSYWPGYTTNHLQLTEGFTNFLWNTKERNKEWTQRYYEKPGISLAGVETISGAEMGGWIQYAMSPAISAWLSQHFYWQWKYSQDERYLKNIIYPYFKELETFYNDILITDKNGYLSLPLSTSPEIHDANLEAWFHSITNFDLSLLMAFYDYTLEIYTKMNDKEGVARVKKQISMLPKLSVNHTGLQILATEDYTVSHRHLSPYMAIYPLNILDIDNPKDTELIKTSIRQIEKVGTREWCGYSFSWMGCMYAMAKEPENALKMLKIFTSNFISPNSFHLNGDQKGGEYSDFTYRPFTLEGNFAFAQAVNLMFLQSKKNYIEVFPAIPKQWRNASFENLRAEGAFLICANRENGITKTVKIISEKDNVITLKMPFRQFEIKGISKNLVQLKDGFARIKLQANQVVILKNTHLK